MNEWKTKTQKSLSSGIPDNINKQQKNNRLWKKKIHFNI